MQGGLCGADVNGSIFQADQAAQGLLPLEKLRAARSHILVKSPTLGSQFHAGFAADKQPASQVVFQIVNRAGNRRLAGL